jgi:hypothetical protein
MQCNYSNINVMLLEEDLKFLLQNEYLRNSLLLSLSLQLKLLFFFVLRNSHYLILFRNYTLVKTNVSTDFFLRLFAILFSASRLRQYVYVQSNL